MSITRVNFVETNVWAAVGSTTLASGTISITAGNTIVACVGAQTTSGQIVSSVTDTVGNTYTQALAEMDPSDKYRQEVWIAKNCLGHASNVVTVTWSASVEYRASVIMQYSGLSLTSPVGDAQSQHTGVQPWTTPALNITTTNYVSFIQSRWGFGGRTFPSGFTRFTVGGAGVAEVADKIGSDGPLTGVTYAINPGNFFAMGVVLVEASSTAGDTPVQSVPPGRAFTMQANKVYSMPKKSHIFTTYTSASVSQSQSSSFTNSVSVNVSSGAADVTGPFIKSTTEIVAVFKTCN